MILTEITQSYNQTFTHTKTMLEWLDFWIDGKHDWQVNKDASFYSPQLDNDGPYNFELFPVYRV